jgi:DNA-binding response OmpR family regulator
MSKEKQQQKVLLAEDDKFISRAYSDGLTRAGFEVLLAVDGKVALEMAKKDKPNIILLDLIMPEVNGFEVLTELKKDDILKDVPVIILSNLGQETDIQKGRELGAIDYLIKANYSMTEVIAKIKKYISYV